MLIEIKITSESVGEALRELHQAAALLEPFEGAGETAPDPAPEAPEEPEPFERAGETAPDPTPEAPEEPERDYSLEEVRAAAVAAARAHGKAVVHELLRSFDAAGLTSLAPKHFPEFMRKLGGINAE